MTQGSDLAGRRSGYWLRRVRLHRKVTLSSAAIAAGLKGTSGSTVGKWEKDERPIKVQHLRRLARFYDVPVDFFTRPQMTDDERLVEALGDAGAQERSDSAAGQTGDQPDDDEPDVGTHRPR